MTVDTYNPAWPPPRHFWRRFLAYIIDSVVLNLIALIPIMIIWSLISGAAILPQMDMKYCVQQSGRADIVKAMKLLPTERVIVTVCKAHDVLNGDYSTIFAAVPPLPGSAMPFPRMAIFIEDASGLHEQQETTDWKSIVPTFLCMLLLPVLFAVFSIRGRQTLGKKWLGLQVRRIDNGFPEFRQELVRECWKLMPIYVFDVAVVAFAMLADYAPPAIARAVLSGDYRPLLVFGGLIVSMQILTLVWWLGPFVAWRGQTWHDRLAGTKVMRK